MYCTFAPVRWIAFHSLALACVLILSSASLVSAQTVSSSGTRISVFATAADDDIRIFVDGDEVVVDGNGILNRFDLVEIESLFVQAAGGDDLVRNQTNIPMIAMGGVGDDFIVGGSNNDSLTGQVGEDSLFGGGGDDFLDGGPDQDFLSGGSGEDDLFSNDESDDVMFGGSGDDRMENGGEMSGGSGDDLILSHTEDACIFGGVGNDRIFFSGVDTKVRGGGGDDEILATNIFSNGRDFPLFLSGFIFGIGDLDGGPGFDIVNDTLDGFGVARLSNGVVLACGAAEDDLITATTEDGMLVMRLENETTSVEKIYDLVGITSIQFQGKSGNDSLRNASGFSAIFDGDLGDDALVNEGTGPAAMFGGPGDDLFMTNTDFDSCVNLEGGNDVYLLNGGSVNHLETFVSFDPDVNQARFDSITVVGSERNESVTFEALVDFGGAFVSGTSQIDLGAGDDVYDGRKNEEAPVIVHGGSGNDTLRGGLANNEETIYGDAGDDIITGGLGFERMFGGLGDDTMIGAGGIGAGSFMWGNAGNDTLRGGSNPDFLSGGPGNDTIIGNQGRDRIFGGSGDDILSGGDGIDQIRGEGGNDTMEGGDGADMMYGGNGNDLMFGDDGKDKLCGEGGDDTLNGGAGTDSLIGGPGVNILNQ